MPKREMASWKTLVQQASDLDIAPNREAKIIPLNLVETNPWQPRQHADEARMLELIDDVRARGILQPLLVRPLSDGRYQVVAGERRYRAASALKLDSVPVISKEMDDQTAREISLVENLQREDLDIEDEARFLKGLVELGLSTHQIGKAIHKSHNYVLRRLRLLDTPGALTAYRAGLLNLNRLMEGEAPPPQDVPLAELGSQGTNSAVADGADNEEGRGETGSQGTKAPAAADPQRRANSFTRPQALRKPFQKLHLYITTLDPAAIPDQEQQALGRTLDELIDGLTDLRRRLKG